MLKNAALANLESNIYNSGFLFLNLKKLFSAEWKRFEDSTEDEPKLSFKLKREHFPFFVRNNTIQLKGVEGYFDAKNSSSLNVALFLLAGGIPVSINLQKQSVFGELLVGSLSSLSLQAGLDQQDDPWLMALNASNGSDSSSSPTPADLSEVQGAYLVLAFAALDDE